MKQAILVVAFGTTVQTAREKNINAVVDAIANHYSDYDVFLAFTSRIIVSRLRERGETIDTEVSMMEKLVAEGYEKVIVQPLHLIGGEEFEKLKTNVSIFLGQGVCKEIKFGRPLLYFMGQEERPDDYQILISDFIESLEIPKEEGVVFIGHGGNNIGNASYAVLQMKLWQLGHNNVRIACLESYPELEDTVYNWLQADNQIKKVHLHPLLLVAGEHALNDIFADEEDSIRYQLQSLGADVSCYYAGLGEYDAIQRIYIQHIADAIAHKFEKRASHRPAIPKIK